MERLVQQNSYAVTAAYKLAKTIFACELQRDLDGWEERSRKNDGDDDDDDDDDDDAMVEDVAPTLPPPPPPPPPPPKLAIHLLDFDALFQHTYLAVTSTRRRCSAKAATVELRKTIDYYLDHYYKPNVAGFAKIPVPAASRVAVYGSVKMTTAYSNNVANNLERRIKQAVNFLVCPDMGISKAPQHLRTAARLIKREIIKRNYDPGVAGHKFRSVFSKLRPILEAYPDGYEFVNGRYNDICQRPLQHLPAFFRLSLLFDQMGKRLFEALPQRRGFIPCCVFVGLVIAWRALLGNPGAPKKRIITLSESGED
ncbi:hypothetical protein EV175_001444 [Coemansia sp. RSA 1933]|nr:hypothetical protein EV175_001444 [Coemansia sp. RSA 1933]